MWRRDYSMVRNSDGDIKYSIGNVVNNIAVTVYGLRWVLDL